MREWGVCMNGGLTQFILSVCIHIYVLSLLWIRSTTLSLQCVRKHTLLPYAHTCPLDVIADPNAQVDRTSAISLLAIARDRFIFTSSEDKKIYFRQIGSHLTRYLESIKKKLFRFFVNIKVSQM